MKPQLLTSILTISTLTAATTLTTIDATVAETNKKTLPNLFVAPVMAYQPQLPRLPTVKYRLSSGHRTILTVRDIPPKVDVRKFLIASKHTTKTAV